MKLNLERSIAQFFMFALNALKRDAKPKSKSLTNPPKLKAPLYACWQEKLQATQICVVQTTGERPYRSLQQL